MVAVVDSKRLYCYNNKCVNGVNEFGGVSERFKELVLKTSDLERGPWVRIPPPPPSNIRSSTQAAQEDGLLNR
jgi:hypothetical protein